MDRPVVRDATLLLLRLALGVVFIAHGYDRLFIDGMAETVGQFSAWEIPQAKLSAWITVIVEILGGAMLAIGLLTTAVAGVLLLLVLAALYFVHLDHGFFVAEGGVELTLVLAVALLVVIVFGSGRASLDGVLQNG